MKKDGNDLLRRQDCIEAIGRITSSMSVCVNTDECHGMKRMQRQAVLEIANMPAVQPVHVAGISKKVDGDCISRKAVVDVLHGYFDGMLETDTWSPCDVYGLIEILPSVQPEQKKGRWEQVEVSYLSDMDAEIKESMAIASMFCPKCKRYHNEVYLYGNPTFGVNFCPNCGADMRQKEGGT